MQGGFSALHFLLSVGAGLGCFLAVGFFSRCSSFLADFVLIVGGVLDCVPKLIDWRFSCSFWLVLDKVDFCLRFVGACAIIFLVKMNIKIQSMEFSSVG